MLIISGEDRIGDALSGLPFVYHMADAEARLGRTVYLMFKNREVLSLLPSDVLEKILIIENLTELWSLNPRISEQRIAHLDVQSCRLRYGARYHVMEAHFVNHGIYLERWDPPRLEFATGDHIPTFDFVLSPYPGGHQDGNKDWPLERWREIVTDLATSSSVCVVGSHDDARVFDDVTYFFDQPLRDVCGLLAKTRRGVLSIDNGIAQVVHALRVPHFVIYPMSDPPTWSPNLNANAYRIVAVPLALSVGEVREALEPLVPEFRAGSASGRAESAD